VVQRKRLTREESKARTRADLLRAARRLFLRNGFVATSLADIAEEAGLTKGAVYSNFESKEDLFLALLAGDAERPYAAQEDLAPSDTSVAKGADAMARAQAWAEHLGGLNPSRRNVALFLEMNAFALRNERIRASVAAHNRQFFTDLGAGLAEMLEAPDVDHHALGMLAQSLYAGLMMHGAYTGQLDEDVFARAYEAALVSFARSASARI
jgi:AcrR family transcriptional regulator